MATSVMLFLLLITLSFLPSNAYSKPTQSNGFAVELIHHDSPRSPYHKPYATISDRWAAAFQRSATRLNYLKSAISRTKTVAASPQAVQIPVTPTTSEYVMKVSVGTPPVPVYLNVDTGSDLIWIQCIPCTTCHSQKTPIFDPAKSFTFHNLTCYDKRCSLVDNKECTAGGQCGYFLNYEDGTYTRGDVVRDDFTMPSTEGEPDITIPGVVFGCGRSNHGFNNPDEAGVAGFNMGLISFSTQVGHLAGYKFSYCFVPNYNREHGSQMLFGDKARLSGNPTPLVERAGNYYYVDLYDLSVGPDRLGTPPGVFRRHFDGTGGFLIDSGSTLTYLAKAGYDMLLTKVAEVVKFRVAQPGETRMLCFQATSKDITDANFPTITFHFEGVDVPIRPLSSFSETSEGRVCLMMEETDDVSLFGNFAQQNLNMGFDQVGERIYMAPLECATF